MKTLREQSIEWWANLSSEEQIDFASMTEELRHRFAQTLTGREIQLLWAKYSSKNQMLSEEEIAEHLLSDIDAYRENIKEMIVDSLTDSFRKKSYWDAWFRGAENKDLEDADRGKVYSPNSATEKE